MTEDEMKQALADNADRIKDAAVEAVLERVVSDMKYNMPTEIKSAVNKFINDEVAPTVVAALQSQKGEILKSVQVAAAQIGETLKDTMVTNAAKNLTGYSGGELLKKLVDD